MYAMDASYLVNLLPIMGVARQLLGQRGTDVPLSPMTVGTGCAGNMSRKVDRKQSIFSSWGRICRITLTSTSPLVPAGVQPRARPHDHHAPSPASATRYRSGDARDCTRRKMFAPTVGSCHTQATRPPRCSHDHQKFCNSSVAKPVRLNSIKQMIVCYIFVVTNHSYS